MSEETREPRSNEFVRAQMEAPVKHRQTGNSLFTVGALLFIFGWILVLFVPSDIRSGHHFWTYLFAADIIIAVALMGIGYAFRDRTRGRLNV